MKSNAERIKSLPAPTPEQILKFESLLWTRRGIEDCWIWTGHRTANGYGRMRYGKTHVYAHRLSYFLRHGEWPLIVDHLCREHCCCNPDHLESVTDKVNLLRGESVQAHNARKTHCKRGHELSGGNLMLVPGGRCCRECYRMLIREHARRWRAEHPDDARAANRKWYQANREAVLRKLRDERRRSS